MVVSPAWFEKQEAEVHVARMGSTTTSLALGVRTMVELRRMWANRQRTDLLVGRSIFRS